MKRLIFFMGLSLISGEIVAQENTANANQIKELFFAGLRDKMSENYIKATTSFSKIVTLDKQNDAAYFELANISLRQNKLIDAEVNIKKAIEMKPNNQWYLQLQSEIYKRNGNMDELVNVLSQLIKLVPNKQDFYFDKANALFISGKIPESKIAYQQIATQFGQSKELTLAQERFNDPKSNKQAAQLLQDNPTDVKNILNVSGVLLAQKKFEEALGLLQKAKSIEPENFEIDLAMADVYQALKNQEKAISFLKLAFQNQAMPTVNKMKILTAMLPKVSNADYAKTATELGEIAVKTSPDDVKLITLYGDIFYQQGKLIQAKQQYQAALKISDEYYLAYEKILGIETLMGDYTAAIKTSDEALTYFPNQAIIYYYRAFALHRNGQNAEAAFEIKNALALAPDNQLNAMIFALQAEVLIDQQKLKEADLAFDKAITLSPENYLILSNYAYYLALREHDLAKAEILAAKAVKALPENASILDTYALVLFKLNKYEEAKKWEEKALQNNEATNPVYLEHYGDILFLKGERDAALLQWQKAKLAGNASEKLIKKINEKKYFK